MHTIGGGRFRVLSRIGDGRFATVWRCHDERDDAVRAVKTLHPRFLMQSTVRVRFGVEARAMLRVVHRNVIEVVDVGADVGGPYMSMELVEGGSLQHRLDEHGPLPLDQAIDCVISICKGLAAGHAAGVAHRDVRPANVLLAAGRTWKLGDFGITLATDADPASRSSGAEGDPSAYHSPEQRTDVRRTAADSDVYGVAATLYAVVTGRPPPDLFAAGRDPALLDELPPELARVITKGTAFLPASRYPDPGSFARAVHELRAPSTARAVQSVPPPYDPRQVRPMVPPADSSETTDGRGLRRRSMRPGE